MRRPMRSLFDPPGLRYSSLTSSVQPRSWPMRCRRTTGVRPIRSRMLGSSRPTSAKRTPTGDALPLPPGAMSFKKNRRRAISGLVEAEITIARRPLGELLVSRGLIGEQELELALDEHRRTGKRLGEVLVELGLISGPELELALEEQRGAAVMKEGGFGTGLLSAIKGQ